MNDINPHEAPKMMTPEEARKRVTVINSGINNLRMQILDFHDREGWKALGYESWTACVEKEFEQSRRQVFYQLQAAQIEKNINDSAKSQCNICTDPIPESQLRPLAQVAPEDQPVIYQLAKETAPDGKLTAAHVEKTVREIQGEPFKRTVAPRSYAPGSLLKDTSDAMLLALAAIEALERIPKNDPQRKAAIAKVAEYCWRQNQVNHVD